MTPARPDLLLVTDHSYEARGRRYCDEDIFLASRLRDWFTVATCHPADAVTVMDAFDVVLVRNSGPVLGYLPAYEEFRDTARQRGTKVFNELSGRADMLGKQYLLDLYRSGAPVIPTVAGGDDVGSLPDSAAYVVKPKQGADSAGMRVVDATEARAVVDPELLVQPMVAIAREVSFYFIDRRFHYALQTADAGARWELEPFAPSAEDLEFAQGFIAWNTIRHGIQRVDACLTTDGRLLLVELEDLNPYLSLDRLEAVQRDRFVEDLAGALLRLARA
ncbi:hypothetical protein GCM10028820_09690 [Tessaracoccus terricola]